jgi:hypothetical protein
MPSFGEIEAILQRAKSDDSTQSGLNNEDFEPLLDFVETKK